MALAKLTKAQIEQFEQFTSSIPDLLVKLENELKKFSNDASFSLSFSDEVIVLVGEFYLSIIDTDKEKEFVDVITAFIGELWIDNFDGEWSINDSKKDTMYLKPIILENRKNAIRKCPFESITLFKEERTKSSFLDNINYSKEMNKKLNEVRNILKS